MSTDLPVLDALNPAHWRRIFPPRSIDRILAEHVVEHWTEVEFRKFLGILPPFLSEDASLRIAVPDGFHPDPNYIDFVKPGGSGSGADDHRVLYNHITMTDSLCKEEYDYELLEYFDEVGHFHRSPWKASDGIITRSADHDHRNKTRALSYTSLIVDAWRKGGRHER